METLIYSYRMNVYRILLLFLLLLILACRITPATVTISTSSPSPTSYPNSHRSPTPFTISTSPVPPTATPLPLPTSTPTREALSRFSFLPSGQYVVYSDSREGGMYVISVDGAIHERLTDVDGVPISPDGRRISDGENIYDLVTNQVSTVVMPEEPPCGIRSGSPDGTMLALECQDNEVYVLRLQDERLVRLSQCLSEEEAHFAPTWSPDGKWIAYFKTRPAPPERKSEITVSELYLVDSSCIPEPDTCLAKTRGPFQARFFGWFFPYGWSPDSRYLAIPGEDLGTILIVDVYGNKVRPLMVGKDGQVWSTAWSLDGEWIAYSYEAETGGSHVWVVSANGGDPIQLTSGQEDNTVVSWLLVP